MSAYPALTHLARAYFHPDFDLEYDDVDAALVDFMTNETALAAQLPAEVDRALVEHPDDATAEAFWLDTLDASYTTTSDGIAGRAWLRQVAQRAVAAGF